MDTRSKYATLDGNEAVAYVAYRTNEVIAIYPITPSSNMAEWSDQWKAEGKKNIWGTEPSVVEMQSEGGAAGAIHGALQGGSLATTFTASQGLLLMIPNMYKIAGELTPAVFHIAARSLACQGLSIFGDHSDVMSVRSTGFAFLCSASVQEAMDFALISQAATLKSRIPFLHFFDGFRTSHEETKIELLSEEMMRAMIDDNLVAEHRKRGLSPDHPVLRGTAQNPDVYFQARETVNPYYNACPKITQDAMNQFAKLTGRQYKLFEYYGAPDAERVMVLMGSGVETAQDTVDALNRKGEKVGLVKVRMYRPFDDLAFVATLPATTKTLVMLDRTKEPGSLGEPLFLDCMNALVNSVENATGPFKKLPKMIGGRYGLSSKEFTPAMVKGIFDHLKGPKLIPHFTIGINDDVGHMSLPYDPSFSTETDDTFRAVFYGLGSDGTVGANKNTIKIIGENTSNYVQGYFVYDSKKAGAVTISHLRFGPRQIHAPYLISEAHFVGCHQWMFLQRFEAVRYLKKGGVFLINSPYSAEKVWAELPVEIQKEIIAKKPKFYVIDAYQVAKETGMGRRINTIMQICFFAISGVLPREQALTEIKKSIRATYGKKGEEIVRTNLLAVDAALAHLHEVRVPETATSELHRLPALSAEASDFVRDVLGTIVTGHGDDLPVSAFPVDGTYPTGTAQYEKRNLAQDVPAWDSQTCIQCGKCSMACPHSVIRIKAYDPKTLEGAPAGFKSAEAKDVQWKGQKYTLQIATDYCTGCAICVDVCPAKNKSQTNLKAINMVPELPIRETERASWEFFRNIPEMDRRKLNTGQIRQQQAQQPYFEFSSACPGCGETAYLKLVSQLFGDRMVVANATGCSSIYGGNLPTTPWSKDKNGRGPAWSNSLFEDNAEFGLGMRLSIDKQKEFASELLVKVSAEVGGDLANSILTATQKTEVEIYDQRERVVILKKKLQDSKTPEAKALLGLADSLVKKSVWIIGGDGWAYDIGFGGLDHVLATGRNVNVLVVDTEVYSNTGGQASKSTPRGAVAKFAADGKPAPKKDLGLMAMTYGNVYVASVAMGARDEHTLKALLEAEAYDGPSIVIAYSHCIAHGIDMTTGMQFQKAAVQSGRILLYRYNPDRIKTGDNPLQLEMPPAAKVSMNDYMNRENRFKMLSKSKPAEAKLLWDQAQKEVDMRIALYQYLASPKKDAAPAPASTPVAATAVAVKG